MRERMARAIWAERESWFPKFVKHQFDDGTPGERDSALRLADAALDAMVEPTNEMRVAGIGIQTPGLFWVDGSSLALAFTAMIRAAREGK